MTVRDLRFKSFDGVELEGTLEVPEGGAFDHLVVMSPGIQVDRNEYLNFYGRLAKYFSDNSVASFRFDWRCHGIDQPRPLTELTLAGLYNDIDNAVGTATKSINRKAKLSLLAQSFSGGVAATWASRNEGVLNHTILLAPILNYIHEYLSLIHI